MGASTDNIHGRWSSSDTAASSAPLLSAGPVAPSAYAAVVSGKRKGYRGTASETSPLNPSAHNRQQSQDSSGDYSSPSDYSGLPPGAAPPIIRGKSISTTGSPRRVPGPSGIGNLIVVNASPGEEEANSMPLVDLTPGEENPKEIPPLYHTIRRDTEGTIRTIPSEYSQLSLAGDPAGGTSATPASANHEQDDNEEVSPIGRAL